MELGLEWEGVGAQTGAVSAAACAAALSLLDALLQASARRRLGPDATLVTRVRSARGGPVRIGLSCRSGTLERPPPLFRAMPVPPLEEVLAEAFQPPRALADAPARRALQVALRRWRLAGVSGLRLRAGTRREWTLDARQWQRLAERCDPELVERRSCMLQVLGLAFEARYSWRWREPGGPAFQAGIADAAFLAAVQSGAVHLTPRSLLRVILVASRGGADNRRERRRVERVLAVAAQPVQGRLFAAN